MSDAQTARFKAEYLASAALQAEFGTFEIYAAYRRAEAAGRVRILHAPPRNAADPGFKPPSAFRPQ